MNASHYPYQPRDRLTWEPPNEPYRPPGWLLLSEAVALVGETRFGDQWTGHEMTARAFLRRFGKPHKLLVPHKVPSFPSVWRLQTMRGSLVYKTIEEAVRVANDQAPKLEAAWAEELADLDRFETAVKELRDGLRTGNVHGHVLRPQFGDLIPVPSHVWGSVAATSAFATATSHSKPDWLGFPGSNSIGWTVTIEGCAVIQETELKSWLPSSHAAGTSGGEARCKAWLIAQMKEGTPKRKKDEVWKEAEQLFQVSRRGFDRAWASATQETNNLDWARPGRRRSRNRGA